MTKAFITRSIEHTYHLGKHLGALIDRPIFLAIDGDLGAGKTHFVQGISQGLDVSLVPRSPTFSIMEEYEGRLPLLHVDFYRLEEEDIEPMGMEEYLELWPGVIAVEWASRFPSLYPTPPIFIDIRVLDDDARLVQITGEEHSALLFSLEKQCAFLG